jgi:hypothetical protein
MKPRTVAAIAATVGALSKATGTTWGYNEDTNEFYEMTPMSDDKTLMTPEYEYRETDYGGENINADIIDIWEAYMASGIPDQEYSMGDLPGVEGTSKDPTENICQNYAIKMAEFINSMKDNDGNNTFNAVVMNVVGTDENGNTIAHVVVKIEDRTQAIGYWIDPSAKIWSEKEETRLTAMQKWIKDPRSYAPFATTRVPITTQITFAGTVVEPQTGQTGQTGHDLTGTTMLLGNTQYTIEHTEELPNAVQIQAYIYDEGITSGTVTSIGKNRITRTTDEYAPAMEQIKENVKKRGYGGKITELSYKDVSFATMKQTPDIEKENAKIILEKRKKITSQTQQEIYTPKQDTIQTQGKNKINEIRQNLTITDEDRKQLEEYAKELKNMTMWIGE